MDWFVVWVELVDVVVCLDVGFVVDLVVFSLGYYYVVVFKIGCIVFVDVLGVFGFI